MNHHILVSLGSHCCFQWLAAHGSLSRTTSQSYGHLAEFHGLATYSHQSMFMHTVEGWGLLFKSIGNKSLQKAGTRWINTVYNQGSEHIIYVTGTSHLQPISCCMANPCFCNHNTIARDMFWSLHYYIMYLIFSTSMYLSWIRKSSSEIVTYNMLSESNDEFWTSTCCWWEVCLQYWIHSQQPRNQSYTNLAKPIASMSSVLSNFTPP